MVDKNIQKTGLNNNEIQETSIALLTFDTKEEQAKSLGISRQALYKRLVNYPQIEEFANKLSQIAENNLLIASIKASEKLIKLIDSPIQKISLQASIQVLDRVGITKENSVPTVNRNTNTLILEKILNDEKYMD